MQEQNPHMTADRVNESVRSRTMRAVRSKNTKPELTLRSALHKAGYRFRIHRSDLPGSPDIVLPRFRTALFVNGCFWHQHPGCKRATLPVHNAGYWRRKLNSNVLRDKRSRRALESLGWRVKTVWECQLRRSVEQVVDEVVGLLESD